MLNCITPEAAATRQKYGLNACQVEALHLISGDLDTAPVADLMKGKDSESITIYTVNFHLRNIQRKMIPDGQGGALHGLVATALRKKIIEWRPITT